MGKPSKLTTDPKPGKYERTARYQNGEDTQLLVVKGITDSSTPVKLLDADRKLLHAANTKGDGKFSLNSSAKVKRKAADHAMFIRAGEKPDMLESGLVVFTVAWEKPPPRQSVDFYLNWMARSFEENGKHPLTAHHAACKWADVSPRDYSLIRALNKIAGTQGKPLNQVLNKLAGTTGKGNSTACFIICWKAVTDLPLPPIVAELG